jgi:hypothetical protein
VCEEPEIIPTRVDLDKGCKEKKKKNKNSFHLENLWNQRLGG